MGFFKENLFSIFLIGVTLTAAIATIVTVSIIVKRSEPVGLSTSIGKFVTQQTMTDDDGSGGGEFFEPSFGKVTVDTSDLPEEIDLFSEGLIQVYEKSTKKVK